MKPTAILIIVSRQETLSVGQVSAAQLGDLNNNMLNLKHHSSVPMIGSVRRVAPQLGDPLDDPAIVPQEVPIYIYIYIYIYV